MPIRKKVKNPHDEDDHLNHAVEHGGHEGGGHDESNWLVSYADMMTLLCGFFVMMFSMANLEKPKFEKVRKVLSEHFHGKYENPAKGLEEFVSKVIHEAGIEKEVLLESDPMGVAVTFQSTFFFDTLSADLKSDGGKLLDKLIQSIVSRQKERNVNYRVVVEGHTDGRPVIGGNFPSNWELSGSRASSVVRMFLDRGFQRNSILAIGYADTRPIATERSTTGAWDDAALSKNRRVVIRIFEPGMDSIPWNSGSDVNFQALNSSPPKKAEEPARIPAQQPPTEGKPTGESKSP